MLDEMSKVSITYFQHDGDSVDEKIAGLRVLRANGVDKLRHFELLENLHRTALYLLALNN